METPYLFRHNNDPSPGIVIEDDNEVLEASDKGLICVQCGHIITSEESGIEINGKHHHTFFNPAGIIYEIGCFSEAPGCLLHGPASSEFTWFNGFTWRLALCGSCTTHLGWFFKSSSSWFYGLISNKLSSL